MLIGAGFGMIFGLVSYSVNRRRRDFTSTMQVLATRYAIIIDPAHVTRARQVLGTTDVPSTAVSSTGAPAAPAAPAGPPVSTPVPDTPDGSTSDAESAASDAVSGEVVDEPRGLTYGEAQDAARRAARERRNAGE